MDNNLDELLNRVNELENDGDDNANNDNLKTENNESDSNDNSTEESSYYGGEFHERDKLSVNNIVDEVQNSFLDYSMSGKSYITKKNIYSQR